MLGGLCILFNIVTSTIGNFKNDMSNMNAKYNATKLYNEGKNRAHIYVDTEGNDRDLTTNHKMFTYRNKDRDLIVKDLKTGKERNIDRPIRIEKYNKEKEKALQKINKNNKVVFFGRFIEKEFHNSFLFGKDRYIDINENIYIKKYMIWNSKTMESNESDRIGIFYLNIKTNQIDYIDIIDAGKIFKHCSKCYPPYQRFDMIYANKEESEKYKLWYNNNICKTREEPLRFCGKFYLSDYKKI